VSVGEGTEIKILSDKKGNCRNGPMNWMQKRKEKFEALQKEAKNYSWSVLRGRQIVTRIWLVLSSSGFLSRGCRPVGDDE